jgi:cation diffusion facilitator family transporter
MAHENSSKTVVVVAFLGNLAIAVFKLIVAFVTKSSAMLAEAIHSFADTGNQILLLIGMKLSQKQATDLHPLGFGRESYFWSFMVAIFLFSLGSAFSIYEGLHKILHPEPIRNVVWAFIVLGGSLLLESVSFIVAARAIWEKKGKRTLLNFLRTSKEPELVIVFVEDFGAELGLLLAFLGVWGASALDLPRLDGAASLGIGLILGFMAVFLAVEIKSLLMGERASEKDEYMILQAVRKTALVKEIPHLITQQLGPSEIMVVMDCVFQEYLGGRELPEAIEKIENEIRKAVPAVTKIYMEPTLTEE